MSIHLQDTACALQQSYFGIRSTVFCLKDSQVPSQHVYKQDLQKTGVSAGKLKLALLILKLITASHSCYELQVIQFAQDLALDELEIETCGCLGECAGRILSHILLGHHTPG